MKEIFSTENTLDFEVTYDICFSQFSIIISALDDVSGLDELSWKIIQGLTNSASNILVITTARYELNISPDVWDDLNIEIKQLGPMEQSDIYKLTEKSLEGGKHATSAASIAHTVFMVSIVFPSEFSLLKVSVFWCRNLCCWNTQF